MESGPIHLIHLDDNVLDINHVRKALEKESAMATFFLESFMEVPAFRSRMESSNLPHAILLDIDLGNPTVNGILLAQELRLKFPKLIIILCSALGDVQTISASLAAGADDFISKNAESNAISFRLYQAIELAKMKRGVDIEEPPSLAKLVSNRSIPCIVGMTLKQVRNQIPRLINSAVSAIYVEGESGTGKEVVADILESYLPTQVPFIRVNCAEIAPSLMESELFGYVKGSFTGAIQNKVGLIEAAEGGWIFLDEIATLSLSAQAALLRTLEAKQIRKIGETKSRPIEFKLLSASNEPIDLLVERGKFRQDLWQRIKEVEINLPPLRERQSEIISLIEHFCKVLPGGPYRISDPAMKILCKYSWSGGNVRELRNTIKAMTVFRMEQLLTPLSIPERVLSAVQNSFAERDSQSLKQEFEDNILKKNRVLNVQIPWDENEAISFDDLCDQLFLEILRNYKASAEKKQEHASLRSLAKRLQMARNTLLNRMKRLREKELLKDKISEYTGS